MKRISIAKTFIIILIILIALFISGSYLMGNMAEKNLQYTIRQFSDKGIGIKKYEKGIFTSSLTLSIGPMDVAKINIIHMPIIISFNNLFDKHIFLLEAFGHVTLFNKNSKISSQEVLVNLNGDIDTRFKVFLPAPAVQALKSINTNLPDDAITGSLVINASDPKVIKAKLKSLIDLKNISSNMLLPVKFNINDASLDLDFYFEKSKTSDEINNKTNIIFNIDKLNLPSMKTNVQNIKINLKIEPQSISPSVIMQAVFGNPINLLNLINADFILEINNFTAPPIANTSSTAKKIKLGFLFNGVQDNLQSKFNIILNDINTKFFSTQKSTFETSININKDLIFYDIPTLINQAKQNNLHVSEEKLNEYLLKIQKFLISLDTDKFKAQGPNLGMINFDKFKVSYGLDNNHNNSFLSGEFILNNLEWNKTSPGVNHITGSLQKSNANIHANFNLSNMILGQNSEVMYKSEADFPNIKINLPNDEFNLIKLKLTGKGNPNDDNTVVTIDSIKFNENLLSDIKFDSVMTNLNSLTFSTLMSNFNEISNISKLADSAQDETQVYKNKISTDMLIYLIKKGFFVNQNFTMTFPNDNAQKLISKFSFNLQPNNKDKVSNLSEDELSELILNNSLINFDINLPVFLYSKLQAFVNEQSSNMPESLQKSLPSLLKYIKENSIITAKNNSYMFKFNYKQGKFYLNDNDILDLIEKINSSSDNNTNNQSNATTNSTANVLKNGTN